MTREKFLERFVAIRKADAQKEVAHAEAVAKILKKTLPFKISKEVQQTYLLSKAQTKLIGRLRKPSETARMMTESIAILNQII
jgi:hypothetical protein